MIFELTDEDRLALEAIRKQRGDRSHAETLRQLIRAGFRQPHNAPEQSAAAAPQRAMNAGVPSTQEAEALDAIYMPAVPVMQRKAFNPQPKKGK